MPTENAQCISSASAPSPDSQPEVRVYTPDGSDRSCKITILDYIWGDPDSACVTLFENGQPDATRTLRVCRHSFMDLNLDPKYNGHRDIKWYKSVIEASVHNPAGSRRLPVLPKKVDPGRLVYFYRDNLEYLEVVVNVTTDKWMIRPIAATKRAATHRTRQSAKGEAKKADRIQMSAVLKLLKDEDATKPRQKDPSKSEAEADSRRSSSSGRLERRESEILQTSSSQKKEVHYGVRPVATNDTSRTSNPRSRRNRGIFGWKA